MGDKIFVDFDRTLTTGKGEPWWIDPLDDYPREEMIEKVNQLYKQGHTVVIYTARREEVRKETKYYLNKWGVMHHALVMEKPGYDLLIDDRVISDERVLSMNPEEIKNYIYD
jgi:energy-coupling factor transporter ATP-binding protein EcfA2